MTYWLILLRYAAMMTPVIVWAPSTRSVVVLTACVVIIGVCTDTIAITNARRIAREQAALAASSAWVGTVGE